LIQIQINRGSGRIIPLGNLSSKMKEAIKTADAYLKANLRNLGSDHDLKGYDFSIQAVNLNQAKEGAETAVAFFVSKDHYDTLILSSGDGDLIDMIEYLSELGKRIELQVFSEGVSTDLQARADHIPSCSLAGPSQKGDGRALLQ
jgi:hypothetical protein